MLSIIYFLHFLSRGDINTFVTTYVVNQFYLGYE